MISLFKKCYKKPKPAKAGPKVVSRKNIKNFVYLFEQPKGFERVNQMSIDARIGF